MSDDLARQLRAAGRDDLAQQLEASTVPTGDALSAGSQWSTVPAFGATEDEEAAAVAAALDRDVPGWRG